jgi:hypothetical protein
MTSTDGKTFTIQHQFVFNGLDALIYHHFPALFYLTALVAHFPTFLFGVLCDANGSMRSNKLSPFQADCIKLPPRTGGQDRQFIRTKSCAASRE